MLGRFVRSLSRKKFLVAGLLAVVVVFAFSVAPVFAQQEATLQLAETTNLTTTDIRTFIANIVRAFFALLGITTVAIILYAGWLWMTSAGNPEKVSHAQKIMRDAAIGLLIIFSAYAIAEFVFRALTGGFSDGGGAGDGNGGGTVLPGLSGSDALGNGIIEYHFPEPGQNDVARNTRISITFKQPLVLSTVFKDYDDKDTVTTTDDVFPDPLQLNTDNFKIIPNANLATAGSGTTDEQFDGRYPDVGIIPTPGARVTELGAEFDPDERQTLVIVPTEYLGNAGGDVNYRVALRGGESGVRVWDERVGTSQQIQRGAFTKATADGGYFWQFTTGTNIDIVPPKISAVVPSAPVNPENVINHLDRNQLLQVYFSEAVDATLVAGTITDEAADTNVVVEARCGVGDDCETRYQSASDFILVPGEMTLGNRLRTAEFLPSAPCENVSQNSCGETVYCLPKNVELRVRIRAASVGADAPVASLDDGVIDMVGNSLDGNGDGIAQGPDSVARPDSYSLNFAPAVTVTMSDSALALYEVSDNVDLIPPFVTDIDPKSASTEVGEPDFSTPYNGGPSKFPVSNPITVTWSKVMSISSIKTGGSDDANVEASILLLAKECKKDGEEACSELNQCSCTQVEPPWFFIDAGSPLTVNGRQVTKMAYIHRPFFTASDLGYSEQDLFAFQAGLPKYVPILRSQLRDVKQNCFSPSIGYECPATAMNAADGEASCCNRLPQAPFNCVP